MYKCESWTIKKAVHRSIDAFELWCWRTLESPLDCKKIKQVHPKGNQSLKGLMLKLKLQYFWPPHGKNWLTEKDPDAGKGWRQEEKGTWGWDGWMASLTQWTWVWASSGSWWWTGRSGVLQSMGSQRVRLNRANELNWLLKFAIWYWSTFFNKCSYLIFKHISWFIRFLLMNYYFIFILYVF